MQRAARTYVRWCLAQVVSGFQQGTDGLGQGHEDTQGPALQQRSMDEVFRTCHRTNAPHGCALGAQNHEGEASFAQPERPGGFGRRALRIGVRSGVALEEAFELGDDQQKQVGDVGPYIAP